MGGVIVGVSAASLAAVGAIVLAVMKKRGKKSAV
jgi:TRAP-type C4-dicarboxylate transport system permease large subunit